MTSINMRGSSWRRRLAGVSTAALAVTAGFAAPAVAQQTEQAQPGSVTLDEIIITAQRREQGLQEVPIAVTAFSQEMLERTAATGLQDVAGKAPGVTMTQFNVGEPQIFVRGVGTTSDSAASDPSIGVSIDEVSIGRAGASALAFMDVQRVEILRGPQGTLYGRNASGGALNVYTNRPDFAPFGQLTARYGSFNEMGLEGVFNGEIAEDTAGRIAFRFSTNDGYAENVLTGADLHGGTSFGLRGQVLREAGNWSFLAGFDGSMEEMDGQARIPVTVATTPAPFVAVINNLRAGLDIRETLNPDATYQNRTNWGITGRAEWQGDNFGFVSLTSYRDNDYDWRDNLGGLTYPAFPCGWTIEPKNRPTSSARSSASFRRRIPTSTGWRASISSVRTWSAPSASLWRPPCPSPRPIFGGDTTFFQDATNTSYAVFGQAAIPFASIWELTLGARWTHDEREVHQVAIDNDLGLNGPPGIPLGPTGSPYDVSASTTFEEPTWRVALSVEPLPDVRFYASYDRGYKAGAYISAAQTGAQAVQPLSSELLDNYEIGAKTTVFDGRLRFNAAAFRLDYTDLQVNELAGLNLVASNAQAEVEGFEIETALAVTSAITIGGSYTSLDAQFTSDAISAGGTLPYEGNILPRSPESQYTLYADGEWRVGQGTLATRIDYQWTDDYFFDPSNNPEVLIPSYGLLSAFASWETDNGFKVSVYGKT
ncbi:TonB-dependent receptor [Brevundimonas denitrificans]|uniref:TonB-dependent receptor n=1 Tax=Brevundimonas denitrificans TaxID=1443434 RepID=UPI00223AEEB8|nr:TonB-dependent receptor [Brevundimonas denitrificans]